MSKEIKNIKTKKKILDGRYWILLIVSFIILVWIIAIKVASSYLLNNLDSNWTNISGDRKEETIKNYTSSFTGFQKNLEKYSDDIKENLDIRTNINQYEPRKFFQICLNLNIPEDVQVEIFNKNYESVFFKGRQIEPEYLLFQNVSKGNKFSIIKVSGLYTYLVIYSPIINPDPPNEVSGAVIAAKILDVDLDIRDKFFSSNNFIQELKKSNKENCYILPVNYHTGLFEIDSSRLKNHSTIDLKGIDEKIIGKLLIPNYQKSDYIKDLNVYNARITSLLVFFLTVLISVILIKHINSVSNDILKITFFGFLLVAIRYVWLLFGFPSSTFELDILSPSLYSSKFGFGISKSIGELLITIIIYLIFTFYITKIAFDKLHSTSVYSFLKNIFINAPAFVILSVFFFITFNLFGGLINSIIFESNIDFFDSANFIPSFELAIFQLSILLSTFSLVLFTTTLILTVLRLFRNFFKNRLFKKYYFAVLLLLFLCVNHVWETINISFEIIYIHRVIIIAIIFLFCYYLNKTVFSKKIPQYLTFRNFSIIILICIIIAPLILLERFKSQETKFVELLGNELTQPDNEKLIFLISGELENIAKDPIIEKNLYDKNKISGLAFYLWKNSKLNSENLNLSTVVIDTNKKILSDFNITPSKLQTDSVVSFLKQYLFNVKFNINIPDYEMDTVTFFESIGDYDFELSGSIHIPVLSENVNLLWNNTDKYIAGVTPIQKVELRKTPYAKIIGYIIYVVQPEFISLFNISTTQIFGKYSFENILNKLISRPIITEYINNEIVNSTDPEVSKFLQSYLRLFTEQYKKEPDKKYWRYDNIGGNNYRTFFILSESPEKKDSEVKLDVEDKIYSISIKREDFILSVFYVLKIVLFSVFVYLILYIIFGSAYLLKNRKIILNFSGKVFTAFLFVSVIPIIILAFYTRSLIIQKNDYAQQEQIFSDLNLISESIKGEKTNFITSYYIKNYDSLLILGKNILKQTLQSSNKNFNIFIKNKLLSTTNEELYKSDLLDTRIDANAYYNIYLWKKDFFLKTQNIGEYSFLVGYIPFKDKLGTTIGVISSHLLYKQREIDKELTETLTFILGSYSVVIIILIFLVGIFTERITKPVLELKTATEKISKGEKFTDIKIKTTDEFGALIESFNKMTKELEKSKIQLKKAEREAAWRDVARRVAHEVKNPLTPMKLSIEHLINIYKENKNNPEFESILLKTKDLIISEIDKLNRIATDFSNFVKLPARNYEPININNVIDEVIDLYSTEPKIKFLTSFQENILRVIADRQELNRIFQNLFKNSIQSIETEGIIEINTFSKDKFVYVIIKDNGNGIPPDIYDRLFEPYFSTKSTGMGLGLPITKKSLDDMKAKIKIDSKVNEGTTVTLTFRAHNDNPDNR